MINAASLYETLQAPEFAGLDDAQVLERGNAKTIERRNHALPIDKLDVYVQRHLYLKLYQAEQSTALPLLARGVASQILSLGKSNWKSFDLWDIDSQQMLALMMHTQVLSEADVDGLLELGLDRVSAFEEALREGVVVAEQDVRRARLYPDTVRVRQMLVELARVYETRRGELDGARRDLEAGVPRPDLEAGVPRPDLSELEVA